MKSLFLYYLLFSGLVGSPEPAIPYGRTNGGVMIKDGEMSIDGIFVDQEWTHPSFLKAIGPVERIPSEAYHIDVYDSKGMMLWREEQDTEVTEFKVIFGPDDGHQFAWWTKGFYTGLVTIEGVEVNQNTSLKELQTILPQYNFTKNSIGSYDGIYKRLYIFAQYDSTDERLVYLAIGLDDDNSWN